MTYTVKRIDEDLNFGCEERPDDVPVMAIVTLVDSSGKEVTVKAEDAELYERNNCCTAEMHSCTLLRSDAL